MVNPQAKVYLCKGTGIDHLNVKGFGEGFNYLTARDFFLAHLSDSPNTFITSHIRGYPSRYAVDNNMSVHLPVTVGHVAYCDFICFENKVEGVFWVGKIEFYEYVNANSTRVHFKLDHWHTWIEKVKFGWCFVERRHAYDMGDPYKYTVGEPVQPPTIMSARVLDEMNKELQNTFFNSMAYYVYLTGDNYQSYTSSKVQFQWMGGAPFYGTVSSFDDIGEVTDYIQSYMDVKGALSDSAAARISNVERIVYAPRRLMEVGKKAGEGLKYPHPFNTNDSLTQWCNAQKLKFGKFFLPQFYNGYIVDQGSGSTIDFNWSTCLINFDGNNYKPTVHGEFQGKGGTYPALRYAVYCAQLGEEKQYTQQNVHSMPFCQFPDIPVNAFMPRKTTFMGVVETLMQHPWSGLVGGAKEGVTRVTHSALRNQSSLEARHYRTRRDFYNSQIPEGSKTPGWTKAGRAAGSMADYAGEAVSFGAAKSPKIASAVGLGATALGVASLDYTNDSQTQSKIVAGTTDEMALAQNLFKYSLTMSLPTTEGCEMMYDFFNHFGYRMMVKEKLFLKHGDNFTYIKLAYPATQDLQAKSPIPHNSFNEISALLMNGVTVWDVEIGSTSDYTNEQSRVKEETWTIGG